MRTALFLRNMGFGLSNWEELTVTFPWINLEKCNIFQVSIQERLRQARFETGIAEGALFVLIYCVKEYKSK